MQATFDTKVFTIRFAVLCCLGFLIVELLPDQFFAPVNRLTAEHSVAILREAGYVPDLHETVIRGTTFSMKVVTECTIIFMAILYLSFVLAAPATMQQKATGILLGLPLLHILDILRIAALFCVGISVPSLFNILHVYAAQIFMAFSVILACSIWLNGTATNTGPAPWRFAIRFVLWTLPLFVVWLFLNRGYVRYEDLLLGGIFSLAGERLIFQYGHIAYFQTFNFVTYGALLLATKEIEVRRQIHWSAAGFLIMAAGHLLSRGGNVLMTAFRMDLTFPYVTAINLICQYLIPFGLWFALTGRRSTHA